MTRRSALHSDIHAADCQCRTCRHQRAPGIPDWLPDTPTSIAIIAIALAGIAINLIQFS